MRRRSACVYICDDDPARLLPDIAVEGLRACEKTGLRRKKYVDYNNILVKNQEKRRKKRASSECVQLLNITLFLIAQMHPQRCC